MRLLFDQFWCFCHFCCCILVTLNVKTEHRQKTLIATDAGMTLTLTPKISGHKSVVWGVLENPSVGLFSQTVIAAISGWNFQNSTLIFHLSAIQHKRRKWIPRNFVLLVLLKILVSGIRIWCSFVLVSVNVVSVFNKLTSVYRAWAQNAACGCCLTFGSSDKMQ